MPRQRLTPSAAFTIDQARAFGMSKDTAYRLLESGELDRVGRGVYVEPGVIDPAWEPLAAATAVNPNSTLCLLSALVWHGLSDAIPERSDVALPRGSRHPAGFTSVTWHSFDRNTFEVGRVRTMPGTVAGPRAAHWTLTSWGNTLAIYSAERTIVDCFRMAHQEVEDVAVTALRRWLTTPGHSPSALLRTAGNFPHAVRRLSAALRVLL